MYPPTPEPLDLSPTIHHTKSRTHDWQNWDAIFVTPELQGEHLTTDMKILVAELVHTCCYHKLVHRLMVCHKYDHITTFASGHTGVSTRLTGQSQIKLGIYKSSLTVPSLTEKGL